MSILKRIGFYLAGLSIGLVLLAYFVKNFRSTESYGYFPSDRVLKNIRLKDQQFSSGVLQLIENESIDSTDIAYILKEGDVDFGRSNTKLDSCKQYLIEGIAQQKKVELYVTNCDSLAKITQLIFIK